MNKLDKRNAEEIAKRAWQEKHGPDGDIGAEGATRSNGDGSWHVILDTSSGPFTVVVSEDGSVGVLGPGRMINPHFLTHRAP